MVILYGSCRVESLVCCKVEKWEGEGEVEGEVEVLQGGEGVWGLGFEFEF